VKTALASAISCAHDRGLTRRTDGRALVLGYHRVVGDYAAVARTEMPGMLISAAMFERHLDWIGRRFCYLSLDEIGEHIAAGRPFERPVAAVTFDDGYRDVYEHAFPILKRKGIPATIFVVSDLVGRPVWQVHDRLFQLCAKAFTVWRDPHRELNTLFAGLGVPADAIRHQALGDAYGAVSCLLPSLPMADIRRVMDGIEAAVGNGFHPVPRTVGWPELVEMQRAGMTVGSHTRQHASLPAETPAEIANELEGSKRMLEQRLRRPVVHFAYPGGQFTPAVVEAVARAGYRYAYTACAHADPRHPALTIPRLLLWERSSVDANGRFAPDVLDCQVHGLWPPARRCDRVHEEMGGGAHG
jgi:peptidoglycan/xylan/chitin deacetylase (PgdA/CDA1 family)